MRRVWILLLLVPFGFVSDCSVRADDWPQWRGPNRDGVWAEENVLKKFDYPQIPLLWRVPIANGYNSPTVADGRVYVMDRVTRPKQIERILCFDAFSGDKIWSYSYECIYKVSYPNGPRAAVTIENQRAYSLGAMGNLYCFDAKNGSAVWKKDLNSEYKIKMPVWGITAAPLIENDSLIIHVGGRDNTGIVVFDKTTGREKWRALNDPINYSSPIIINQVDKRVLVSWTSKHLVGLDPVSGKIYWQESFSAEMGIATPVFHNDFIFVSSFFDGSMLVKLDNKSLNANLVWQRKGKNEQKTDSLHCCISTPLLMGDYIYGVDSYGELRCLNLHTGDRVWENLEAVPKARWANIHMVQNGDYTWMFNERGELIISQLSPKGFHEISRSQLIAPTLAQLDQRGGVCWSHPAYAYKNIYIRNDEELICASLALID
jgi:outer membrane protein assembly factor BamB